MQGDHGVFLALVERLEDALIVAEVLMQLQMEDGQQRHGRIEVVFLLMEVKVHGTEVDFELR